MNLRSLNSSSMQGASFDREIASGFARKAISQDGEAVRSDSSAVAVDDAQVARTTSAPVVLRVGFKAGKMTAGKHGEDPEVSEAVRRLQKSRLGYRFTKRAFDIVFSAFVLVSFSWLFVIVAIPSKSTIPRPPSFSSRSALVRMAKNSTCTSSAACAWMPRTGSPSSGSLTRKAAQCSRSLRIRASLAWASGRVGKWSRKLSLASVIIGTPGAGEPTNSLSSAAKTSLDQQFYECARKLSPATQSIIPAPNSCLSPFSGGGSRKAQNELEARADGADQGGSPWCDKAFYFMNKNGACDPALALGVAA